MQTITATVTLNPAFLQEIKEDNRRLHALTDELNRIFTQGRPDGMRRYDLLELLDEYRDQLATHFALEEAFGYFEDPLSAAPRLSETADELRRQHGPLFQSICDLAEKADELFRRLAITDALRELGRDFLAFESRLDEHEARENDLILQAFNDDIGVGD